MRILTLGLVAAASLGTAACSDYGRGGGFGGFGGGPRQSAWDWNRPDPAFGRYDADRYYVDNPRYRDRRLGRNDRIYAGRDGRYYCRRNDGTTGLIVGGIAGGALGSLIAPGGSGLLGALLGGAAGAAGGRAIDRNNVRCR